MLKVFDEIYVKKMFYMKTYEIVQFSRFQYKSKQEHYSSAKTFEKTCLNTLSYPCLETAITSVINHNMIFRYHQCQLKNMFNCHSYCCSQLQVFFSLFGSLNQKQQFGSISELVSIHSNACVCKFICHLHSVCTALNFNEKI